MRRTLNIIAAATLAAFAAISAPAVAADNISIRDATAAPIKMCSVQQPNGSQASCNTLVDTLGVKINPATRELEQQILTALGSPLQAGGAVTITGQPTVLLGSTAQATLDAIKAATLTPPQPATATYVQLALAANTRAQIAVPITGMVNGVVCTAVPGNAADVLVGSATVTTAEDGSGNGFPMVAGGSWSEAVNTTANTWFISTAPAAVACHGN